MLGLAPTWIEDASLEWSSCCVEFDIATFDGADGVLLDDGDGVSDRLFMLRRFVFNSRSSITILLMDEVRELILELVE